MWQSALKSGAIGASKEIMTVKDYHPLNEIKTQESMLLQSTNIHGEKRMLFLKKPINKRRYNNKVNKNHHLATITVTDSGKNWMQKLMSQHLGINEIFMSSQRTAL